MSKTFQPDSLHPYIMDARLKKVTGSGGISNIPIASADTVGGIMIGGSANPITVTGSGNASIRKATSELLGVVKAGDGVSVDADGTISGVAYSDTAHKTGRKWLDGRDIWEKTIVFSEPVNITTSYTTIETDTDVDVPISTYAVDPTYKASMPLKAGVENSTLKVIAFDAQFTAETVTIEYVKPTS